MDTKAELRLQRVHMKHKRALRVVFLIVLLSSFVPLQTNAANGFFETLICKATTFFGFPCVEPWEPMVVVAPSKKPVSLPKNDGTIVESRFASTTKVLESIEETKPTIVERGADIIQNISNYITKPTVIEYRYIPVPEVHDADTTDFVSTSFSQKQHERTQDNVSEQIQDALADLSVSLETGAFSVTGAFSDSLGSTGSNGFVLQSTGAGVAWVATSTLGIVGGGGGGLASTDIDTSSELASILGDEVGTGRSVFSISPAFGGTATFSSLTATGTSAFATSTQSGRLTLSGIAANIALGSNYLSGDGGDEGVFVDGSGNVGIGTSTPVAKLEVQGSTSLHGLVRVDGISSGGDGDNHFVVADSAGNNLFYIASTFGQTTATFESGVQLLGPLYDETYSAGTLGYILQTTGTGVTWVATSTLGLGGGGGLASTDIDTSSELLTILTDETGSGNAVFSVSPEFSGLPVFMSGLTASGTLDFSGTEANIALGSNYLSGDGDDEGVFVDGSGNVGIGTTTPVNQLSLETAIPGAFQIYRPSNKIASMQFGNSIGMMHVGIDNDADFAIANNDDIDTANYLIIKNGTGNVGIGTVAPDYKLDVRGSGNDSTSAGIQIRSLAASGNTSASAFLNLKTFDSSGFVGSFPSDYATASLQDRIALGANSDATGVTISALGASQDIRFFAGSATESMRINSSGNVGIGTTTPTSKLTVAGDSNFTGTLSLSGSAANIALGNNWLSGDGGDEGIYVSSTGNVGVGLAGPRIKTEIASSLSSPTALASDIAAGNFLLSDGGNIGMVMGIMDAGGGNYPGYIQARNNAGANNLAYPLLLNPLGGNVGIGTTSPQAILHTQVTGTGNKTGLILGRNTVNTSDALSLVFNSADLGDQGAIDSITTSSTAGDLAFRTRISSALTEKMRITSSGNVGIGTTTPLAKLVVSAGSSGPEVYTATAPTSLYQQFRTTATGTAGYSIGMHRPGDSIGTALNFSSLTAGAASTRMVLTSAGQLGIGTTTPGSKLTVAGSTDISAGNLDLDNTTFANQNGIITKNGTRFIHNFNYGFNGATTTLGQNTFVGLNAGNFTMGSTASLPHESSYNTGVGTYALSSNTKGFYNTATGYASLIYNTTGSHNTANGYASLYYNTTGSLNTATGYASLIYNTTGSYNTANGYESLYSNTTGSYNTTNGMYSLYSNTTGSYNTTNGYASLHYNTTGAFNTALGMYAGYEVNTATSTGANTIIGYNTGRGITTGVNNTILGANVTGLGATLSNNIIIADGAGNRRINVDSSGNVGIGTATPADKLDVYGDIRVGTGTTGCVKDADGTTIAGTCSSDERLKTNILPISESGKEYLAALVALEPVTYNWNELAATALHYGTTDSQTGLIAQQVEETMPELVTQSSDGYKQVRFSELPIYLLQALRELWTIVTGNQEKIELLEDRIEALETALDADEDVDDTEGGGGEGVQEQGDIPPSEGEEVSDLPPTQEAPEDGVSDSETSDTNGDVVPQSGVE